MRSIVLIILAFLSGCSGGGSGGESSGSAATGVRVLHASLDLPAVDILSSARPDEVVSRAHFAQDSLYGNLPTGPQDLVVTIAKRPGRSQYRYPAVDVQRNERRSVFVFGDQDRFGIEGRLLQDSVPELERQMAALRVLHGVVGAAEIAVEWGNLLIAAAIPYGQTSEYVSVPAAAEGQAPVIRVRRVVDGKILHSTPLALSEGTASSLVIGGDTDYFVSGRVYSDR